MNSHSLLLSVGLIFLGRLFSFLYKYCDYYLAYLPIGLSHLHRHPELKESGLTGPTRSTTPAETFFSHFSSHPFSFYLFCYFRCPCVSNNRPQTPPQSLSLFLIATHRGVVIENLRNTPADSVRCTTAGPYQFSERSTWMEGEKRWE